MISFRNGLGVFSQRKPGMTKKVGIGRLSSSFQSLKAIQKD